MAKNDFLVETGLSIAQKTKCVFSQVFQIVKTLEMKRLFNYYEKQKHTLFSCCSLGVGEE